MKIVECELAAFFWREGVCKKKTGIAEAQLRNHAFLALLEFSLDFCVFGTSQMLSALGRMTFLYLIYRPSVLGRDSPL